MNILHIYKDYHPVLGGIENHIKTLAEGLATRGHRVTVLVTNTAPHSDVTWRGNLTIAKTSRLLHLASTPLSLPMPVYARCMKGVDVINLHFPYPPGDLVSLAVPGRPPLVVSYHSDIVRQQTILRAYTPLLIHTLNRATRIVAASPQYIASSPWLRPRAARCVVSPYSVDLDRFATPDEGGVAAFRSRYGDVPLLLFVGRFRYYKGLHFLLEALTLMQQRAHLLLVGTGPEEQRLNELAQSLGVAESVSFLGEVSDDDLPTCYHAATAFVLPSHLRSEAFGIVQLEAQAAGLPIVCTELGTGTSYITQHGQTGFVVPPASPAALARALDVLLANPNLARRMGQAGRGRAEREFSHTHLVERMEHIYAEACSPQNPMV